MMLTYFGKDVNKFRAHSSIHFGKTGIHWTLEIELWIETSVFFFVTSYLKFVTFVTFAK